MRLWVLSPGETYPDGPPGQRGFPRRGNDPPRPVLESQVAHCLSASAAHKPSPDPIYPAYAVGDSDNISETTQVAAVTRPKSGPDQLDDLL